MIVRQCIRSALCAAQRSPRCLAACHSRAANHCAPLRRWFAVAERRSDYDSALRSLADLRTRHDGINTNTRSLLSLIEACHRRRLPVTWSGPAVHVTGSNGKGTVATAVARALSMHGVRAGCFTSPHLYTVRERVAVDGRAVDAELFAKCVNDVLETAGAEAIPCTTFEALTLAAILAFHRARVAVAVVEVGLGGRLDATTAAITGTPLCVIVSAALEHTSILGSTVEAITREKCGIMKPGSRCIVGPSVPMNVVAAEAERVGATFERIEVAESIDAENSALLRAVLHAMQNDAAFSLPRELSSSAIQACLAHRPHGLYEWVRRQGEAPVVLDVAHNPAAFQRLFDSLRRDAADRDIRAVLGFSSDKDAAACLEIAMRHCTEIYLVQADSPRAATVDKLREAVRARGLQARFAHCAVRVINDGDVRATIEHACAQSVPAEEAVLLVAGSFFLFREVAAALQLPHAVDAIDLNESSVKTIHAQPTSPPSVSDNNSGSETESERRSSVLSIYHEMHAYAKHLPDTTSVRNQIREQFRQHQHTPVDSDEYREYYLQARSKLAFLRMRVSARHWRQGTAAEVRGKGKQSFVYDSDSETLRPMYEEAVPRTGTSRINNSQGITDEQRRRHYQLMDRFQFRGPRWAGKR